MKGLKSSILFLILTLATCSAIIIISGAGTLQGFKKVDTGTKYASEGIVIDEGVFPGDINYEFAQNRDIYHIKWSTRSSIEVYDILSQKSETLLTPINPGYKIDSFCKSGNYLIWKESSGSVDEQDEGEAQDWKLYIREGNNIIKLDEMKQDGAKEGENKTVYPEKLSVYGDYLVYKTGDTIPGTDDEGTVIKLYDLKNNRSRIIFSLLDLKGTQVSDPYIYKNTVVWSICKVKYSSSDSSEGDIYTYDMMTGSYSRLTERAPFIDPKVWENYIICQRQEGYKTGITVIDSLTGVKKEIASSDNSLSPVKEVHDYSVGSGYVTWNTSYADSVCVYDILNDRVYQFRNSKKDDKSDSSLLNIYIYDKTLLYTDHVFSRKNGRTISETKRYILLK